MTLERILRRAVDDARHDALASDERQVVALTQIELWYRVVDHTGTSHTHSLSSGAKGKTPGP